MPLVALSNASRAESVISLELGDECNSRIHQSSMALDPIESYSLLMTLHQRAITIGSFMPLDRIDRSNGRLAIALLVPFGRSHFNQVQTF